MRIRDCGGLIGLFCLMAAVGCAAERPRDISVTLAPRAATVAVPRPRATSAATAFVQATPRPTNTWVPTPTPRPTATRAEAGACWLMPSGGWPAGETVHDAVLFVSPAREPGGAAPDKPVQLWAVAADGSRAARLTLDERGIGWYAPDDPPPALWVASAGALPLDGETAQQVALPAECVAPDPRPDTWRACGDFAFSPGGQWLAYAWGAATCRRSLGIVGVNGEQHHTIESARWLRFLPDGDALIETGDCDQSTVAQLTPQTGAVEALGPAGRVVWNGTRSAFAMEASSGARLGATLWGFDVERSRLFLAPDGEGNNQPVWAPGDEWLVYQRRAFTVTASITVTMGPREIAAANVLSGEERVLAADDRFDYHLCASAEAGSCAWRGDWIRVRRLPYQPAAYGIQDLAAAQCAWYGAGCAAAGEALALNWRTGELAPWTQFAGATAVPSPSPTATRAAVGGRPDASRAPLYTEPAGRYALYLGQDGRSLWCVPALGAPLQWVANSEAFTYVP